MPLTTHNPAGIFPPYRAYSHAVEVTAGSRLLFISGLNGYESDGKTMPDSFEGQAEHDLGASANDPQERRHGTQ